MSFWSNVAQHKATCVFLSLGPVKSNLNNQFQILKKSFHYVKYVCLLIQKSNQWQCSGQDGYEKQAESLCFFIIVVCF